MVPRRAYWRDARWCISGDKKLIRRLIIDYKEGRELRTRKIVRDKKAADSDQSATYGDRYDGMNDWKED